VNYPPELTGCSVRIMMFDIARKIGKKEEIKGRFVVRSVCDFE
jgi:hypothetical protein